MDDKKMSLITCINNHSSDFGFCIAHINEQVGLWVSRPLPELTAGSLEDKDDDGQMSNDYVSG